MTASHSEPPAQLHDPVHLIDAVPGGRLLVIGSLPPAGRDLDLAVRRCDLADVDAALADAGFLRTQNRYVRFSDRTAQIVDTTVLEEWDLPAKELDALLERARLLPGMRRMARPAPEHTLLLLAPLCARAGSLTPRRRARLEAALAEDPGAWQRARGHAPAWRATRALALLHRVADGGRASVGARIGALAQPRRERGTSWVRASASAARRIMPRPRRGAVVAFSGVDGAGKSSQAAALAAALERLGEDPVIVWSRVRYDPLLASVGRTAKKLLAPIGIEGSGTVPFGSSASSGHERTPVNLQGDPIPPRVVEVAWAHVSAVIDGYRHLRLCLPAVLHGKIVICDRYTLDTHVHLAERFGSQPRAVRSASWLDRRLSPRPLRTFWLDIAPHTAWARKPDDVHPHRLNEHARLYRSLYTRHDAIRLDTGDLLEETAQDVAARVTSALGQTRSRSALRRPGRPPRPDQSGGTDHED